MEKKGPYRANDKINDLLTLSHISCY